MSGIRNLQLIESGSGTRQRVERVVGVDESGTPNGNEPYVFAAVHCPRSRSEQLAEALVHSGLEPWKSKSSSLTAVRDKEALNSAVERLLEWLSSTQSLSWAAVVGWDAYTPKQRAAAANIVASKALSSSDVEFGSDSAAVIHDGGENTYGRSQIYQRRHATTQFGSGFDHRICPVYLTALPDADLSYPEVTAADYLAGYIRNGMREGTKPETMANPISRIDRSWKAPQNTTPAALYRLRETGSSQMNTNRSRVVAWIEGRRTTESEIAGEKPYEDVVSRLDSGELQTYLKSL